jgi:uncharacterized damage-inducible protein DinB
MFCFKCVSHAVIFLNNIIDRSTGQVAQDNISLSISIEWWQRYQDLVKQAIAPLTADQLAFRLGTQRSASEIIAHIIAVRAWYLHGIMGEGGSDIESLIHWDSSVATERSSVEFLTGIDQTWQLLTACLARWTVTDMGDTFFINWLGHDVSRGFVVWHMLEHEIHHGGELSFTLGSYGLPGVDV